MSGPYTVNLDSFSLDALPPETELPTSIRSARHDSSTKAQSSVSAVLEELASSPMLRNPAVRQSKKTVDRAVGVTLDDLSLHERRLKEHVDSAFARQEQLLRSLLTQKTGLAQQAPSQAMNFRDVLVQYPANPGSGAGGEFPKSSPKGNVVRENSTASRKTSRSATSPAILKKDNKSASFGAMPSMKILSEKGSVKKMERAEQEQRDRALAFSRSVMENRRLSRKMSEVTNFKTAQKSLQRLTTSTEFELVMASAIFANAIMLGVECNYFAVTRTHDVPDAFFAIGISFTALFTVELLLRLAGEGFSFFHNSNWLWNYLDLVIVVSSLFELSVDIMRILRDKDDGASAASGLASMRILRLVRITRLMRIFRISKLIRLIKALQTLVYSILCTLKSLVWAMLLLILLIYVFGIIITQATTDFLVDTLPEDAAMWHVVNLYWGNLGSSMFTLFKCISNGVSWDLVVEPLGEISVSLLIIFNMFIVFAYFSVLNVVTGVFCQSAIDAAQHDKDMLIQNHVMHRERYTIKAQNLFAKIKETTSSKSCSNKEFLTLTEFEEALQSWEVQAFFDALEVDATDAWALFKLLDTEGTHRVSIGEFIDGCMRVKGSAKSVDMIRLMQDQQTLRLQLMHFKDSTEVRLVWLMKILGDVLCVDTSEIADFTGLSNSNSHDVDE